MDITAQIQELLNGWQFITADRFINAALALLLTMVFGFITGARGDTAVPLYWRFIDVTFGVLGARLDKKNRKEGDLILRGFIVVVFMLLFTGALGVYAESYIPFLPQSRLIEVLLLSFCMSSGAVWINILHIYRLSQNKKAASQGQYLILARTSRIDLSTRDKYTITRTGAEVLVRMFDKAAVTPALWYALGGVPAVFMYSALAAYSWKNSYDGNGKGTGLIGQALEKLMGFVMSVFSASLLAMTTGLSYEQGGQPLSVLAYALKITLGGAVKHVNGRSMKRDWTGPKGATAKLDPGHLKRILYMVILAHIFLLSALIGASVYASL